MNVFSTIRVLLTFLRAGSTRNGVNIYVIHGKLNKMTNPLPEKIFYHCETIFFCLLYDFII